ncbi:MAG: cytochrome b/b6 domain-containing protein [bacterium]|nr:cytochrome b/b6 domain-containing protein [bacterium]
MKNTYVFSRYERLWHWLQTLAILALLCTGFQVKGLFNLIGFEKAVKLHNTIGLGWLIAFAFFVFWIFTTGEWKQYIPTSKKMAAVVRYYLRGIFKGEPHPVPRSKDSKHNPLQRLTYLLLALLLLPIQMVSGFLYWSYNNWEAWGLTWLNLSVVSIVHLVCAFAILSFLITHVYMVTTGHKVSAHMRAMVTGWEEIESDTEVEEWEKKRT